MPLLSLLLAAQTSLAADEGVLIDARGVSRPASVLGQPPAGTSPPTPSPLEGAITISPGGAVAPASVLGRELPLTSDAAPISVDFQDDDIHNVLHFFASVADINVVASDDVSGQVTMRLQDVPWDMALMTILRSQGLGTTMLGGSTLMIHPVGAQP